MWVLRHSLCGLVYIEISTSTLNTTTFRRTKREAARNSCVQTIINTWRLMYVSSFPGNHTAYVLIADQDRDWRSSIRQRCVVQLPMTVLRGPRTRWLTVGVNFLLKLMCSSCSIVDKLRVQQMPMGSFSILVGWMGLSRLLSLLIFRVGKVPYSLYIT